MATTFKWVEMNGASGSHTETDMTNLNFGNHDSANLVPATYPIAAGANSYAKYVLGYWSGDFTQINNVKFWKQSGDYVTAETISFSGSMPYATPATSDYSADGAVLTAQPGSNNVAIPGDLYPGSGSWPGASTDGIIYGPGTGSTMPMRLQLQSTASTPAGAVNQKVFAITYDQQ